MAASDEISEEASKVSSLELQDGSTNDKSPATHGSADTTGSSKHQTIGKQTSADMKSLPGSSPDNEEADDSWSDDEYYTPPQLVPVIEASKRMQKELFGDKKPVMEDGELEVGPEIEEGQ